MSYQPLDLPPANWTLPSAPRIAPAPSATLSRVSRATLWLTRQRTGESADFNVFRTLARLGRLFPAHAIFLSQLLARTRLAPAEKELVVLRTAWRLGCAYEYGHHHHMASELGVPPTQLAAATTENAEGLTPRLKALLLGTDVLVSEHQLDAPDLQVLRLYCTDDDVLELCMLVGHYVMIAMIINTAGVQPEPAFALVAPV
jgi:alkylhydroperoxidase family enzyme